MAISELVKLDDRPARVGSSDILAFVAVRNEVTRLPYFLRYYRELGIGRFFFVDNGSSDGTADFILDQPDCHCFHTSGSYFDENVAPPGWTNAVANAFGDGHWSLTVDADELLVYPDSETVALARFCAMLDEEGAEALYCPMIDMYGDGPLADARYTSGLPFLEACPYFDPTPGWIKRVDGACPEDQMFGGVRERVFWKGAFRKELPPCISKVPLVKWRRGMKYLHSMHFHSGARLSRRRGALLHFKFLGGMVAKNAASVAENTGVVEKGLGERAAYIQALLREPKLGLKYSGSVRYTGTPQLARLGWISSANRRD